MDIVKININDLKLIYLYINKLMNLDCDADIIRMTIINLREELKSERELTRLYEVRVKNIMNEWKKKREEYENKIESLEGLLELQNNLYN